jgi:hypothetical protein
MREWRCKGSFGLPAGIPAALVKTAVEQNRAMREYAGPLGWMIALQVREVNSGAMRQEVHEKLLEAARRVRSMWC